VQERHEGKPSVAKPELNEEVPASFVAAQKLAVFARPYFFFSLPLRTQQYLNINFKMDNRQNMEMDALQKHPNRSFQDQKLTSVENVSHAYANGATSATLTEQTRVKVR
jgi:hypothetical protein